MLKDLFYLLLSHFSSPFLFALTLILSIHSVFISRLFVIYLFALICLSSSPSEAAAASERKEAEDEAVSHALMGHRGGSGNNIGSGAAAPTTPNKGGNHNHGNSHGNSSGNSNRKEAGGGIGSRAYDESGNAETARQSSVFGCAGCFFVSMNGFECLNLNRFFIFVM
jgi:hypothetical protein